MKVYYCLGVILTAFLALAENPCNQVNTKSGSYCLCSANYCDTVPTLKELGYGEYRLYNTSKENLGFHATTGTFSNKTQETDIKVEIDLTKTYQTITGFGGAFTDATGINIASLSKETQEVLLQSYFGESGIQYSMGRIPIGGTDFSLKGYTYCDQEDESLDSFQLQDADINYKIPYVQRALDLRGAENLKFITSAWSAPVWMKNTDKYNGFGKIEEKYYGTWARYYIKFFEAYEKHNITFWGVTTQNEPIDGLVGTIIQNNGFTPSEMKKWIKDALGPTIRNSSYSNLKIILHDDQRILLPILKSFILSDSEVVQFADGIGVHFYTDFFVPGSFLNFASVDNKALFRLATEACAGSGHIAGLEEAVDLGSWPRAETYLTSIFTNLEYDVIGWIDWNMALNTSGGPTWINNEVDSPIIVNATSDEFYKQPMYYALGHFSKFVIPGSVRVNSLVTGTKLKSLAFLRPDEKLAVVLWNKSSKEKTVTINIVNSSEVFTLSAYSINTIILGL